MQKSSKKAEFIYNILNDYNNNKCVITSLEAVLFQIFEMNIKNWEKINNFRLGS